MGNDIAVEKLTEYIYQVGYVMQSVPAILWPFLLELDKNEVGIEDGLPTYK